MSATLEQVAEDISELPYAVVYRDQPEQIEIVAVAHGARRPGYWRNRL